MSIERVIYLLTLKIHLCKSNNYISRNHQNWIALIYNKEFKNDLGCLKALRCVGTQQDIYKTKRKLAFKQNSCYMQLLTKKEILSFTLLSERSLLCRKTTSIPTQHRYMLIDNTCVIQILIFVTTFFQSNIILLLCRNDILKLLR